MYIYIYTYIYIYICIHNIIAVIRFCREASEARRRLETRLEAPGDYIICDDAAATTTATTTTTTTATTTTTTTNNNDDNNDNNNGYIVLHCIMLYCSILDYIVLHTIQHVINNSNY